MNSILSIMLMAIGSICAASFYVPIKKIKNWSWESYWIVQGLFSWIIAPLLFAWLTVPSGTLGEMIRLVAQLGGYVNRKRADPPSPGTGGRTETWR